MSQGNISILRDWINRIKQPSSPLAYMQYTYTKRNKFILAQSEVSPYSEVKYSYTDVLACNCTRRWYFVTFISVSQWRFFFPVAHDSFPGISLFVINKAAAQLSSWHHCDLYLCLVECSFARILCNCFTSDKKNKSHQFYSRRHGLWAFSGKTEK